MPRIRACLSLALAIVCTIAISPAAAQPSVIPTDELLVGFHGGVTPGQAEAAYRGLGAAKVAEIRALNVHRVRVPGGSLRAVEAMIARRPEVKFVERNKLHAPDAYASDPYFPDQWHLWKIEAPGAWDITPGAADVVIAILDSGVDPSHPDLAPKLVPGYNFYDRNTDTRDVYGHGTKVAGAAAAVSNNGVGVSGVAWANRIMPIRVTGTNGWASTSALASGLTWAVDHGARVMNMSFNGVLGSSTIASAAQYVSRNGGVVVAAAGNCGCVEGAADNPHIISVSASDVYDNLASWSSRGDYIDVAAPGAGILTTTMGGGYGAVSGTSFASPVTAGVAALVLSINPRLQPLDVDTLLKATAVDRGASGWDSSFGFGRIDAHAAVSAADGGSAGDATPPTVSITSPSTGAVVTGATTVAVEAADDGIVDRVELFIDGVLYASDAASPFGFYLGSTPAGAHTLVARAVDGSGNMSDSAPVSITVSPDGAGPTVSITSVVLVRRKLNVTVSAADDSGLAKVELYLDGTLAGSASTPESTFALNVNRLPEGEHELQAKAYDTAGNVASSGIVRFSK